MGSPAAAMMSPALRTWSAGDFGVVFAMWTIMMIAMMVPSAAPIILLHARVQRQSRPQASMLTTWAFVAGYLAVWTGFSALATLLQWQLENAALLSPMMVGTSRGFGAAILLAAGVYQLTPLKQACLHHCRSPIHFVVDRWRAGLAGALRMGAEHGAYCAGCCWLLMALLFVGGVMNLYWIALLSVLVLVEKVGPGGPWIPRTSGLACLGWAAWLLMA